MSAAIVLWLLFFAGSFSHPLEILQASLASTSGTDRSANGLSAKRTADHPEDSKHPVEVPQGVPYITYADYLDGLCAPLSEVEEDRLLAESGRSTQVLLGLAFGKSPRFMHWMKEALLKAPNDPLVHYAVLQSGSPWLDPHHSAVELVRLAPQDASPLYFLASEAFKSGDLAKADKYLQDAFQRERSSSYRPEAFQLMIDNYMAAGRSETEARARVALEYGRFTDWESAIVSDLAGRLNVVGPDGVTLWGSDERTAMLIDADQKLHFLATTDLITSCGALMAESFLLKVLSEGSAERLGKYLPAPASEMLANAKAELAMMTDIMWFAHDKPGIYQRLQPEQRTELIDRFYRDGEVSAYKWAYQTRPDIFKSPDFVPNGRTKEWWTEALAFFKAHAAI